MNRLIRVDDTDDHVIPRLPTVLKPLEPEARQFNWSVLDLGEVVPGEGSDLPDPYVDPRVVDSPHGWQLTFSELIEFGDWARQIIDGVFIGCRPENAFPARSDDDATLLTRADMLVAAIDSSFWVLSVPDSAITRVEAAFEDVVQIEAGEFPLSTRGRDY